MKVASHSNTFKGSCVDDECVITAVLPLHEETVTFLAALLDGERARRGTRAGTRALTCREQAVLVLRWFCDSTRMRQLARDNAISISTGYDYLHEASTCSRLVRRVCTVRSSRRKRPVMITSPSTAP